MGILTKTDAVEAANARAAGALNLFVKAKSELQLANDELNGVVSEAVDAIRLFEDRRVEAVSGITANQKIIEKLNDFTLS
jgi:hypothetical protein